jgi:hypothetical protein
VDFAHNDHRASFVPMMPGNRDSVYADSSYDSYRPPTSGTWTARNHSSSHLAPMETRQPKRLSDYGGQGKAEYGQLVQARESYDGLAQGNERATRRKSRGNGAEVNVYEDRSQY